MFWKYFSSFLGVCPIGQPQEWTTDLDLLRPIAADFLHFCTFRVHSFLVLRGKGWV